MTTGASRDGVSDRVLPATRVLSATIVPFLVVAFVLLYFWPSAEDTARLFAWRIAPPFTPMLLASVYLGGAYFFVRAVRANEWHRIGGGFVSVGTFASLMGVATILHWDRFIHANAAFWLWTALYFTTPFLVFAVWFRNRREEPPVPDGDLLVPQVTATLIGMFGVAAGLSTAFLFLLPDVAIRIWPWTLTVLTARVTGAIFALGIAGVGAFHNRRWSSARILLQVEGFMFVLIFVAVVRAHADFATARPLTWTFATGFLALAIGSAMLYARMERLRLAGVEAPGAD